MRKELVSGGEIRGQEGFLADPSFPHPTTAKSHPYDMCKEKAKKIKSKEVREQKTREQVMELRGWCWGQCWLV